ncbi:MAG: hypothetical protein WAO41_06385 [Candidatus Nanopelagicales bacterium]
MTRTVLRRWLVVPGAAVVISLSACSGAQQVIDQAQSIAGITEELQQVCIAAAPAWAPGTAVPDAAAALEQASTQASALIDAGNASPALVAVDQALTTALDALAADPTDLTLTTAVATVNAACSVVNAVS